MEQEYKSILVGIDGSDQSITAFKKAVEVARRNNGKVYVVHVIEQQFYNFMGYSPIDQTVIDDQTERAQQMIEECKEYAKTVDYPNVEGIIAYGSVKEAMAVNLPKKYGIELIMVGQSGLNTVERFMTGSVASYVIRRAPCDVLIISDTEEKIE